ncbi:Calmodulin-lysine N-methyltransferase [Liparis tanakae]|uniref:Calmodulin-lysine N-methyltransferase n=1 Tax=Liparis tanakae TaxID=230148 RepID=A0A4Z2HEP1_9TELE|nr:Calmodulin-lysine N-methyltransferase [Liparis tanakae]
MAWEQRQRGRYITYTYSGCVSSYTDVIPLPLEVSSTRKALLQRRPSRVVLYPPECSELHPKVLAFSPVHSSVAQHKTTVLSIRFIPAHIFEDKMERDSNGTAETTKPASPLRKNINQDTCAANSHSDLVETCGTPDVARARWTLLRQVLRQKQADNPDVKQVSVRRFATFDLFIRKRILTQDSSDNSDDQWVEYRSVFFPEYSALLRHATGYAKSPRLALTSQMAGVGVRGEGYGEGYFIDHWAQTM